MGDPFSAIGFNIQDEESFQRLAEQAHTLGTPSTILRQNILLQGFCWHLGEGLEIWTILKEGKSGTFYTDCRPAFRSSLYYPINSWEIIEFVEDGEAILSGQIQNFNLSFELQNFTEISESIFNYPSLRAQIAGLCTRFQIIREQSQSQLIQQKFDRPTINSSFETDIFYKIKGRIISIRQLINPVTKSPIFCLLTQTDHLRIEIILNQNQFPVIPSEGCWISAEVWMQGHLINSHNQVLKYEGLDQNVSLSEHWSLLKREN